MIQSVALMFVLLYYPFFNRLSTENQFLSKRNARRITEISRTFIIVLPLHKGIEEPVSIPEGDHDT